MHKCPAYNCKGELESNGDNFTCPICNRSYGKPSDLKDYEDYNNLFKDDLVVAVRKLLKRIENSGDYELEDSEEHNELISYFNKFGLHKKVNKKTFQIFEFKCGIV